MCSQQQTKKKKKAKQKQNKKQTKTQPVNTWYNNTLWSSKNLYSVATLNLSFANVCACLCASVQLVYHAFSIHTIHFTSMKKGDKGHFCHRGVITTNKIFFGFERLDHDHMKWLVWLSNSAYMVWFQHSTEANAFHHPPLWRNSSRFGKQSRNHKGKNLTMDYILMVHMLPSYRFVIPSSKNPKIKYICHFTGKEVTPLTLQVQAGYCNIPACQSRLHQFCIFLKIYSFCQTVFASK